MWLPVRPFPNRRGKHPRRAPVIVARAGGQSSRAVFQGVAQMLGPVLVGLVDTKALGHPVM